MKYVIGFYSKHVQGRIHFVRVYKNGKQWVERLHGKTATQFDTKEEALTVAARFGIVNPEIHTI